VLLRRYLARPKGPVTAADRKHAAERADRAREAVERNKQAQSELELLPTDED
jgi:hypothetical protein